MTIQYLNKSGGARLKHVDTYRVICDDPSKFNCLSSFLNGHENTSGDDFSHIALAKYKNKDEFVIKILSTNSMFLPRELKLLQTLKNYKNVVQYICHISCDDDKSKWVGAIINPITPCFNKGNDSLTYIKDGSLIGFLQQTPTLRQLHSLFLQTAYTIMEIGLIYNIYHGDINSGNILLKKTPLRKTFRYMGSQYELKSFGFQVVFIDFGRGNFFKNYPETTKISHIIDDILISFDVFTRYISSIFLKEKLISRFQTYELGKKISFSKLIELVDNIFIEAQQEWGNSWSVNPIPRQQV